MVTLSVRATSRAGHCLTTNRSNIWYCSIVTRLFDPAQCRVHQVPLPFGIPDLFPGPGFLVREPFDPAGAARVIGRTVHRGGLACAPFDLIGDLRPCNPEQPGLERTDLRIVFELSNVLGHRHDRFLHHLLGFVVTQAPLQGKAINQPPVRIEKSPANSRYPPSP
jgi:hypothetical protein